MELRGKKISFIGDSITEGVGVSDKNNRYDVRLREMLGLAEAYNYGVSGTRLAHQTKPSPCPRFDLCFCGRIFNIEPTSDVIVIYGGVNDYIHGDAPIGKPGDTTPATFCGAVRYLMNHLAEHYPNATAVFMTPARNNYAYGGDENPSGREGKLPDAKPLLWYVDVINETAKDFNVHVLDLYRKLPINPNNEEDKAKYTVDGLHFNDEGHKVLAETLADFLKSL